MTRTITTEPKAPMTQRMVDKNPQRPVLLNAIHFLYSNKDIVAFIREQVAFKMPQGAAASGSLAEITRQSTISALETNITIEFDKHKADRGKYAADFTDAEREKWLNAIAEVRGSNSLAELPMIRKEVKKPRHLEIKLRPPEES